MEVLLLSGFILGFAGSVHCVGMCGPLALSLPFQQYSGWQKGLAIGGYHLGRISSYMGIGIVAGIFGRGLNWFGLTQIISITLGSFIVLSVLLPRLQSKVNIPFLKGFKHWQITTMQSILQKRSVASMFFFGLLNGFLPCGLVYTAVAASLVRIVPNGPGAGGHLGHDLRMDPDRVEAGGQGRRPERRGSGPARELH